MIGAIVYNSCTGSCEKYARMMSQTTGVPAISVKDYSAHNPKEEIVYVGWLLGGVIQGLGKARKKGKVVAVCQVGMGPENSKLEDIARKKNSLCECVPVFYLQGSFHLNKLPLPFKLIMKMKNKEIAAGLAKKAQSCELNPQEQATFTMASTGSGEPAAWNIDRFKYWYDYKV